MLPDKCTKTIHSPPPAGNGTLMDSAPIAAPDLSPFLRIVKSICGLQSYGRRAGDARLISIRYSHYNERARWALDLSPLPYTEDAHPPGFAQFAIQDVTDGRKSASPVLVLPDGEVLDNSTLILRRLHQLFSEELDWLYPNEHAAEIREFEDELSEQLGAPARQLAYAIALDGEYYPAARSYLIREAAMVEKLLFAFGGRRISRAIVELYNCRASCIPRAQECLMEIFDRVSQRLGHGGRYLYADRFTAADLTFAALAWPVIFPPAWEQSGLFLPYAELPQRWRHLVDELRDTPAGMHALRIYEEHRFPVTTTSPQIAPRNPRRW
jgi:glutathione S-transferase